MEKSLLDRFWLLYKWYPQFEKSKFKKHCNWSRNPNLRNIVIGPDLSLWIPKGAKFWPPFSTMRSGLVMIGKIFQISCSYFFTLTKSNGLNTSHRRVRALQTCYLCKLVKFTVMFRVIPCQVIQGMTPLLLRFCSFFHYL